MLTWALLSLLAASDGGTPPPVVRTAPWLHRAAAREGLRVAGSFDADLDGEGPPERVTLLCDPGDEWATYRVVEQGTERRWVVESGLGGRGSTCGEWLNSSQREVTRGLLLSDSMPNHERTLLVLQEGGFAELSHEMGGWVNGGGASGRERWDWTARTYRIEVGEGGKRKVEREHALVVAVEKGAPVRSDFNVVTFGQERWTGPADASLRALAVLERGGVRLRLEVMDDVVLPVAEKARPKAFLSADHVELWWCSHAQACHDRQGDKLAPGVRQLGVAVSASGTLDVRWLWPEGHAEPLPQVTRTDTGLEVVLPWGAIGWGDMRAEVGPVEHGAWFDFTAAYSDADGPEPGQQTLVASSRLKWGEVSSFGRLVVVPGGGTFPRKGFLQSGWTARRLGQKDRIRSVEP